MAGELIDLTALDARDAIARRDISATELMDAQLRWIAAVEPAVGAFAYLDFEGARAAAGSADTAMAAGKASGALHGVPVGIKDIIDTAGMPTENGTPLDAGRRPTRDAEVVRRLRAAGAIVMGKTVTTELGAMHPRGTRNPHDPTRTPGGSSSGSAAAVAARMVALALGTQTNGSVIRPASFCGVVGFKPSFGLIPRTGVLAQAPSLDTVGVFARTVADAALIVDVLAGYEPPDPGSRNAPPPQFLDSVLASAKEPPRLAFVEGPAWNAGEPAMVERLHAFVRELGPLCQPLTLPAIVADSAAATHTIGRVGIANHYRVYYERGREQLSDWMRGAIEEGMRMAEADHGAALEKQRAIGDAVDSVFDRFDALVTPAAPGEAPPIATTGNPAFNSLWSLCGVPAISLPLLKGPHGLPIGVQLVGRRGKDAGLLATAHWLMETAKG